MGSVYCISKGANTKAERDLRVLILTVGHFASVTLTLPCTRKIGISVLTDLFWLYHFFSVCIFGYERIALLHDTFYLS